MLEIGEHTPVGCAAPWKHPRSEGPGRADLQVSVRDACSRRRVGFSRRQVFVALPTAGPSTPCSPIRRNRGSKKQSERCGRDDNCCWKADSRRLRDPNGSVRAVLFNASNRRPTHIHRAVEPNIPGPTLHALAEERRIAPEPRRRRCDASGNTRRSRHSAVPVRRQSPPAVAAADPLEPQSAPPPPVDRAAKKMHLPVLLSSPLSPPKTSGRNNANFVQRLRKSRTECEVFAIRFRM